MDKKTLIISDKLNIEDLTDVLNGNCRVEISANSRKMVNACRNFLDKKLAESSNPVYGINTGFGSLCDTQIPEKDLSKLQENLVLSHACGIGDTVIPEIVRLMLVLKIQSLSYGHSGVQEKTLEGLCNLYNNDLLPVVYEQGSLGASGDLAPLAHLCLPLLGKGKVMKDGKIISGKEAIDSIGMEPLTLSSKEGLALLNGTQFMSSYGIYCIIKAEKLLNWADCIGSLSIDAFDGRIEPFNPLIQEVRPHNGQIAVAQNIRKILNGSEIIKQNKTQVQDPYSFRCIPQVHGASRDAINYVKSVFCTEINSVTDNPTVFPSEDLIISAGNFHGQPLAITFDFMGIALSELGNISERRTYQLINGKRGLPHYLVVNSGLNSGFMIPQYTAASIVSQSKQLACPASTDSIVSSQGQEDHVSMGANAATKTLRIIKNLERVLAIELFTSAQAFEFRRPLRSSQILENLYFAYRKDVPFIENDTFMSQYIHKSVDFINSYPLEF